MGGQIRWEGKVIEWSYTWEGGVIQWLDRWKAAEINVLHCCGAPNCLVMYVLLGTSGLICRQLARAENGVIRMPRNISSVKVKI